MPQLSYDTGSAARSNVVGRPYHINGKWTEERTELAKTMWREKYSASQIAAELNCGITRNGVIGKMRREGLSGQGGQPNRPRTENGKRVYNNERRRERHAERVAAGRLEFAPRLAPDDLPEVPKDDPSIGIPMLDLEPNTCRWVCDTDHMPQLCCGQPTALGSAWCEFHRRIVYLPRTQ